MSDGPHGPLDGWLHAAFKWTDVGDGYGPVDSAVEHVEHKYSYLPDRNVSPDDAEELVRLMEPTPHAFRSWEVVTFEALPPDVRLEQIALAQDGLRMYRTILERFGAPETP